MTIELPTHSVVYYHEDAWAAIPAVNGDNGPSWQWGNELLVGFIRGTFQGVNPGHQCREDRPFESWLSRSHDGGETWNEWRPENYVGQLLVPKPPEGNVNFSGPGFVMRVVGNGYHGNEGAHWFYSDDRGAAWNGPFDFGDLLDHPELAGKEFTGRTAYLVGDSNELYLFLSARIRTDPSGRDLQISLVEKSFLVRSDDGGKTFSFVSWIVPWDDPCRGVMPQPVRISKTKIIAALRRKSPWNHWIDCYQSEDNGLSWSYLSKVENTEVKWTGAYHNGNPPALVLLADGRLCCCYGDRSNGGECIAARFSEDDGQTWSVRHVIREEFQSVNGMADLGYVRLFQRPDGKCVAVYFWCSKERPQTHIECTIF